MNPKEAKNVKAQRLRDYIVGLKNSDMSTKFCPSHPEASCSWNSGNGYYRLECPMCKKAHNIFSILGNFDLSKLPKELEGELAYAQRQYVQVKRAYDVPFTYPTPKGNPRISLEKEPPESIMEVGQPRSPKKVPYTEIGLADGKSLANREQIPGLQGNPSINDKTEADSDLGNYSGKENPFSELAEEDKLLDDLSDIDNLSSTSARKVIDQARKRFIESIRVTNPQTQKGAAPSGEAASKESPEYKKARRSQAFSPVKQKAEEIDWEGARENMKKILSLAKRRESPFPESAKPEDYTTVDFDGLPSVEVPFIPYNEFLTVICNTFEQRFVTWFGDKEFEAFFDNIYLPRCLDAWARRDKRGNYTLCRDSEPIRYFDPKKHCLAWKFDTRTRTYDCLRKDINVVKLNPAPERKPTSYAGAVIANMTKGHVDQMKRIHQEKLVKSPEYAQQFLKSGKMPKPIRKVTELDIVYGKIHKAEKGDIRRGLRSVGIQTENIIDINFVGVSVSALTVPKAEANALKAKLRGMDLLVEDFNPLSNETAKYNKINKEPIIRLLDRLNVAKKVAADGGRLGLSNFYNTLIVNNSVDFHNKKFNLELEEREIAKKRRDFSRLTLDKIKELVLDEIILPSGPMGWIIDQQKVDKEITDLDSPPNSF